MIEEKSLDVFAEKHFVLGDSNVRYKVAVTANDLS